MPSFIVCLCCLFFLLVNCNIYLFSHTKNTNENEELRLKIADISQDLSILDRTLRNILLELKLTKDNSIDKENILDKLLLMNQSLIEHNQQLELNKIAINEINEKIDIREKLIEEKINNFIDQVNGLMASLRSDMQSESIEDVSSADFSEKYDFFEYEVEEGDTLGHIAIKFDSSIAMIQNANSNIINPSRDLLIGDIIYIPKLKD